MTGGGVPRLARIMAATLLVLACAWLALACLANGQSRARAASEPWTALTWDPDNPQARSRLAEQFSGRHATAADSQAAIDLARAALTAGPLDGAALRVLGIEAQRAGDMRAAVRLMAASDRVTQRDSTAQLWLLDQAIRRGAYETAYAKAEVALRGAPAQASLVFPVMRMGLKDPRALPPLLKRLEQRPQWREAFVADAFAHVESPEDARRLFLALRSSAAPPDESETGAFVRRLVADGAYAEAHDLWRSGVRSAAAAGVYGGDFRIHPGEAPFNWRLTNRADALAELAQAADGGPALRVQFSTASNARLAEQLLVLPPGVYRLHGQARAGMGGQPEQLAWRVTCAGRPGTLAEAGPAQGAAQDWGAFEARFAVPPTGCEAQWLTLDSFALDRIGVGEAWYRDIAITPGAGGGQAVADAGGKRS